MVKHHHNISSHNVTTHTYHTLTPQGDTSRITTQHTQHTHPIAHNTNILSNIMHIQRSRRAITQQHSKISTIYQNKTRLYHVEGHNYAHSTIKVTKVSPSIEKMVAALTLCCSRVHHIAIYRPPARLPLVSLGGPYNSHCAQLAKS